MVFMASDGTRAFNGGLGQSPSGIQGQTSLLNFERQTTNFRLKIARRYDSEYAPFLSRSTAFLQTPESLNCHSSTY